MGKKYYEGIDGLNIPYLEVLSKRGDIKKNIVIIHGMAEHIHRYEEFSEFLASNGYNVYVLEYRGHGELKVSEFGDFGKLGLTGVVDDVKKFISEKFKEEKPIMIGVSMGSEITQRIVIDEQIQYYILSGQPYKSFMSLISGRIVTRLEIMSFFKKKSILNKLFTGHNKKFAPNKTYADWLSRDEEVTKKYANDELCGYNVTPKFFNELINLMAYTKKNISKTKEDASALIVFGDKDYVSECGKAQKNYAKMLKNKKRKIKLLKNEGGRHESLNETNKYQIYDEILQWLNDNVIVKISK